MPVFFITHSTLVPILHEQPFFMCPVKPIPASRLSYVFWCTIDRVCGQVSVSFLGCNLHLSPVKNVTWILEKIPPHFSSQIDDSLAQIDLKFHDNSMSFIQVLFVFYAGTWHGFWTSSSHGISMAFARNMMEFPSDLVSFSTKLPSKTHEKIRVTFFTGNAWNT